MISLDRKASHSKWEIPFQVVLHGITFLFYALEPARGHQEAPHFETYEFAFFANYVAAAWVINYVFFPKFLYLKKYLFFFLATVALITLVTLMEELVLEHLFFPNTRANDFDNLFYTLADVLPVTLILCGFKLAWDIIRKQMEVDQLGRAVTESELRFLKSQLNPHFLFNTLNNLYAHAIEQSPKTPEIIVEISALLRYMLYESNRKLVSLNNEIAQLGNFIRLYEMQIEGRGGVNFKQVGCENTTLQIAPLILIVFVENAFKHSAEQQSEHIDIDIAVEVKGSELKFTCRNLYAEEDVESGNQEEGIGLANVRKRLDLIYPKLYQLEVQRDQGCFQVVLNLQLSDL